MSKETQKNIFPRPKICGDGEITLFSENSFQLPYMIDSFF